MNSNHPQNLQEDNELISITELIKKIQSLHAHFTADEINNENPFRSIYLYGSSVYENKAFKIHSNDDDYIMIREGVIVGDLDILLVRDGFHHSGMQDLIQHDEDRDEKDVFFEHDITLHFKLQGSKGNWYDIETHIMSTSIFMETIRQHKGITCQYVFMDRNEFVIYEDDLMRWFRSFWFRNFHFHRRLFRRMIVREADVWCYSKARRLITIEKDYEKGKKNLIHGIRYFRLGNQILENLTIHDYTVTNDLKKEVLSQSSTDWKYWEGIFEPMYLSERDEFNKKVDIHIQGGLKLAADYSEKMEISPLCKIIQDFGLQYLSLNYSTDIIPLAIFDQNGNELDIVSCLTCESLIRVLLSGLKLDSDEYRNQILKQLSNAEMEIRGYSILFKITQLEEMERIDETIPRKPLRETNGIVVSALITDSLELLFKPVAIPIPKVYDEFRWLNSSTKNRTQSSQLSFTDIEEITSISKNYRGDVYILYNYSGKWRWSHPEEDLQYFTKLSNVRNKSLPEQDQFFKLLSTDATFEEIEERLCVHKDKNFIFVRPISENFLSLIAVRDLTDNLMLDLKPFSSLLFDCQYVEKENIDVLQAKASEMSSDLLYKLPYKCSSQHEKDIVTVLKYLYYNANSLDFCFDGFNINLKLKNGGEYSVKCQSQFYYNMNQLSVWHTSINIDDVEDGKFNKFHGNILSQSNELLLIEMALIWLESSWDEQVLELERKRNPKIIPFSEIYFTIKQDWKSICQLYDDFCESLKEKIKTIESKDVTKFIAQNSNDFGLENKTIIYKVAETNFQIRAIQVFNSPKRCIDSNSLVKIWKDYKKKNLSN